MMADCEPPAMSGKKLVSCWVSLLAGRRLWNAAPSKPRKERERERGGEEEKEGGRRERDH